MPRPAKNVTPKVEVSVEGLTSEQKDRIKTVLDEVVDSMDRSSAEKDLQKELIEDLSAEIGLEKKLLKRMAKVYHNDCFGDEVEENDKLEQFYKSIIGESR